LINNKYLLSYRGIAQKKIKNKKDLSSHDENKTHPYFTEISDLRVTGHCLHLLSDILMIGLCTYLTGGTDYLDMRLIEIERGASLGDLLSLPNGVPSEDTFEQVFKSIVPKELEAYLHSYGKTILSELSEKQIVIDGKKQRGASLTTR